ncbi:MAG: helix-turn-helix domain-containing protein [Bacteroidota bacterium]
MTEIAYRLHYSSVAYLSNQFKSIIGLTPTFYRGIAKKEEVISRMCDLCNLFNSICKDSCRKIPHLCGVAKMNSQRKSLRRWKIQTIRPTRPSKFQVTGKLSQKN